MWLFLAFLLVPLIEIALFIQVGGLIGLWPTLAIVVATAVLGAWLVRNQGIAALAQLRGSFANLDDPSEPLAHGAMILAAGALLLTPGFFTDAVGFALLTPGVRRGVLSYLRQRIHVESLHYGSTTGRYSRKPSRHASRDTIDGEFQEVDMPEKRDPGTSGWTKH